MGYSKKKLQELANADLIWPKKSQVYRDALKNSLQNKGLDISILEDPDMENDWVHEELWWDVCAIVNDLAQMVLDEREKTATILKEAQRDLQDCIQQIKKHNQ